MMVIFDSPHITRKRVAINVFQVAKINELSSGKECSVCLIDHIVPIVVNGSLEEVTAKLNQFAKD